MPLVAERQPSGPIGQMAGHGAFPRSPLSSDARRGYQ